MSPIPLLHRNLTQAVAVSLLQNNSEENHLETTGHFLGDTTDYH